MISAERKKFGLVSRKAVKEPNPRLSNTVLIEESKQTHTCTIGFSDDLVQFIGGKLPRGLAEFDPAYLIVSEQPGGKWLIQACYVRDHKTISLWLAAERPKWLKTLK